MRTAEERRLRHNELARQWRSKNRNKALSSLRNWQSKNKEHMYSYNKARYDARTVAQKEETRAKDRTRHKKKREEDREGYNARLRRWSNDNPGKVFIRNKRWVDSNKDKVRAAKIRRRARGDSHFTSEDISRIRKLQGGKCGYCREVISSEAEQIDHIVALANGGTNNRTNVQLLCASCNRRKARRDPIDFARSMGMLI